MTRYVSLALTFMLLVPAVSAATEQPGERTGGRASQLARLPVVFRRRAITGQCRVDPA